MKKSIESPNKLSQSLLPMIKLVLLAIIILSILGAIVILIFSSSKPQNKPPIPVAAGPKSSVSSLLSGIKISDIQIKEPPKPIFANLFAPKQTRASGYVRLSQITGKILIQLKSDDASDLVGIVYKGSCFKSDDEIVYLLASLNEGKSQTIWEINMEAIQNQLPLSIKVFKDTSNLKIYTRCADLKMP